MSFNKKMREIIHSKYDGHCAYCGCEISIKEMEIDHIIPKYHFEIRIANVDYNEDDIINLNPACRDCNRYKETLTLENFRYKIQTIVDRLKQKWIFRIALKYGLLSINNFQIKFYYELKNEPKNT